MHTESIWRGSKIIGRGANRICVIDPNDSSYCLKFDMPLLARNFKGIHHIVAYLISRYIFKVSENRLEWRAYQKLKMRLGFLLEGKVAACMTLKHIDGVSCLQCQRIRVAEESAPSLNMLITNKVNKYRAAQLCAAVDDYVAWLIEFNIPLFDLNPGNFVVVEKGEKLGLVCVDIKSTIRSKELVPLSRWVNKFMHKKIVRRAERLKENIYLSLL